MEPGPITIDDEMAEPFALKEWAAVPVRTFGDRRLRERHYRVFGAICRAVNSKTGLALISQQRIAKISNRHRNKVGPAISDLARWGYLIAYGRGRHRSGDRKGRYKTRIYRVIYDPSTSDHALPEGCTVLVTSGECKPVQPVGVADSTPSPSNLLSLSSPEALAAPTREGQELTRDALPWHEAKSKRFRQVSKQPSGLKKGNQHGETDVGRAVLKSITDLEADWGKAKMFGLNPNDLVQLRKVCQAVPIRYPLIHVAAHRMQAVTRTWRSFQRRYSAAPFHVFMKILRYVSFIITPRESQRFLMSTIA